MDNLTENIMKNKLMEIADLLHLKWDEYDCELHFTLKSDFENDLFYEETNHPGINVPDCSLDGLYKVRVFSDSVQKDMKDIHISSLSGAYFLVQHIFRSTKKGDVICIYDPEDRILIHKVNDGDNSDPKEFYLRKSVVYQNTHIS